MFLPLSDTELSWALLLEWVAPGHRGATVCRCSMSMSSWAPLPRASSRGVSLPGVPVMEIRLGSQEADHRGVALSHCQVDGERPGAIGCVDIGTPCSTSTFRVSRNPVRAASWAEWCPRRPDAGAGALLQEFQGNGGTAEHHDLVGGWGREGQGSSKGGGLGKRVTGERG